MADPTIGLLAALVGAIAVGSAVLAAGHRLSMRIALRNVRRGRGRTVLLVLGLLVAAMIISSSLVLGDTVQEINAHFVYQSDGYTDEAMYNRTPSAGFHPIPFSTYRAIANSTRSDGQIAGITPEVLATVTAFDPVSGVPQTGLNLVGADPNASGVLGAFTEDSGKPLEGASPGEVLLDDQAASELNATAGDALVIYGAQPARVVVEGVVRDDLRGGFEGGGSIFADLSTSEGLENLSGEVNFLSVTNAGSQSTGVALSASVSATLNATLAGLHLLGPLSVHELLKDDLASAQRSGQSLVSLFLVLGSFSIVAGAMLIVGIFVMLAEERKGEMGMLRAVGLKRRHLVLAYYFEGLVYSAGSALAGTALGVGVALGLLEALVGIEGGGVSSQAILAAFTVSPRTLSEAYVAGFVLTLTTVAVASYRASRLNIVRAIRSVPEPPPALSAYTGLAYLGVGLAGVGGVTFLLTRGGTGDLSVPIGSLGVAIVGLGLIGSRFVRNRIVFSVVGALLLLWGGFEPLHHAVLGADHTGTISAFFADGLLMILGAVLVYVFNAHTVAGGVARLFGRKGRRVALARIGLSYPTRRPFRTAITLTIFALVLFTIVGVATIGSSIGADLDGAIRSESGGYTFFGSSVRPIPDLPGEVAQNATLARLYTDVVPLTAGAAAESFAGLSGTFVDSVFSANASAPGSSNFYSTNEFNFTSTLGGRSAQDVWRSLSEDPGVAVVDHAYAAGGFNFGAAPHPTLPVGTALTLTNPENGHRVTVTVFGILSEDFIGGVWVDPAAAATLGETNTTAFFLSVAPGVSATAAANAAKVAFLPYGLTLFDFAQILQSSIQSTEAVVELLEVFVALGLAVGVAAIGIVALRAVVERRSEIGMLRAAGFTRRMVLGAFLTEYSFVGLLGIGIGAALGIALDWNASLAYPGLLAFSVPWANVLTAVGASYALTLAAIAGPSLKAAALPPAEAIRYSE
ncbi:MAG TPA: FtsX-like permease family protein [Thermoplasmata archaeon]|nr:FtsX-like permease family protein [Thermoplasmata archaeon]